VTDYSKLSDSEIFARLSGKKSPGYDSIIASASEKYSVPEDLIRAVIDVESSGSPGAVSPVGARGLMQLMPGTAKDLGLTDPHDPWQNIHGGTKYLSDLWDKHGNADLAVKHYNPGEPGYRNKVYAKLGAIRGNAIGKDPSSSTIYDSWDTLSDAGDEENWQGRHSSGLTQEEEDMQDEAENLRQLEYQMGIDNEGHWESGIDGEGDPDETFTDTVPNPFSRSRKSGGTYGGLFLPSEAQAAEIPKSKEDYSKLSDEELFGRLKASKAKPASSTGTVSPTQDYSKLSDEELFQRLGAKPQAEIVRKPIPKPGQPGSEYPSMEGATQTLWDAAQELKQQTTPDMYPPGIPKEQYYGARTRDQQQREREHALRSGMEPVQYADVGALAGQVGEGIESIPQHLEGLGKARAEQAIGEMRAYPPESAKQIPGAERTVQDPSTNIFTRWQATEAVLRGYGKNILKGGELKADTPYEPFSDEELIKLKQAFFNSVTSGSKTLESYSPARRKELEAAFISYGQKWGKKDPQLEAELRSIDLPLVPPDVDPVDYAVFMASGGAGAVGKGVKEVARHAVLAGAGLMGIQAGEELGGEAEKAITGTDTGIGKGLGAGLAGVGVPLVAGIIPTVAERVAGFDPKATFAKFEQAYLTKAGAPSQSFEIDLTPEEVRGIFARGGNVDPNLADNAFMSLGLKAKEIRQAAKTGITIQVPEGALPTREELPWWTSIKRIFGVEPQATKPTIKPGAKLDYEFGLPRPKDYFAEVPPEEAPVEPVVAQPTPPEVAPKPAEAPVAEAKPEVTPAGMEEKPKLSYEEFSKQYREAFNQSNKYTPDQIGSRRFTDEMADLADAYPGYLERFEAEEEAKGLKPEVVKEPWEMTKGEYLDANSMFPAIRNVDTGEVFVGNRGQIHSDIYDQNRGETMPRVESGWSKDGKWVSYKDASNLQISPDAKTTWKKLADKHEAAVTIAKAEGKPVPNEVLADYPELKKPEAKPVEPTAAAKEPWEQTKKNYVDSQTKEPESHFEGKALELQRRNAEKRHAQAVLVALTKGEPIPEEVLKDYPDLAEKYGKKPEKPVTTPGKPTVPKSKPDTVSLVRAKQFRKMADTLTKQIEHARRPMTQNPTPKRDREYRERLHDSNNMERTQRAMTAIADGLENGTLPDILKGVKTKDEVSGMVRKGTLGGGYYDVIPNPEYHDKSPRAMALQDLIEKKTPEQVKADEERVKADKLLDLEGKVQFQKIEGFFPTPKTVISAMMGRAHIKPGMKVLEPSAGKGDIADAAKDAGTEVDTVEIRPSLRDILEAKGHNVVGEDFLEFEGGPYDRILMNPPFEKGQDATHVEHAYKLLKPGGRLVAIMSEGTFFRETQIERGFRDWLDEVDGQSTPLPPGSFKGPESFRTTGVQSRMVVIDKPKESVKSLPEGYKIQEVGGLFDVYRPDGELAGTRRTRDDAVKYAHTHSKYKAPDSSAKRGEETRKVKEGFVPTKYAIDRPIEGPTGAKIIGYEWRKTRGIKWHEGKQEDVEAWVSDWDDSDRSEGTGREIVHIFYVEHPDGKVTVEGINSAQNILGISESRLKTIAKNEQAEQEYKVQGELEEVKSIEKGPLYDTPREAARGYRQRISIPPGKGAEWADDVFDRTQLLKKDGKFIRAMEYRSGILQRHGWELVTPDPAFQKVKRVAAEPVTLGSSKKVFTPKGNPVEVQYGLHEAGDLITSHDAAGNINKEYPPELQPRDRTRVASKAQIATMANKINPELLGESAKVSDGAPIIGPDGVVESGNARTIALREAYKSGKGEEYKRWLASNADKFGLSEADVFQMEAPVLVRIRKTELDRAAFSREANQADIVSMSPSELARADANRISDDLMAIADIPDDGNVLSSQNGPFLRGFLQTIGKEEAAQYLTRDGKPTRQLADRIKAVIFEKAYGSDKLLSLVAEEADVNIKNVVSALTSAAPEFAKARVYGVIPATIDIPSHVVSGAELYQSAKTSGKALEAHLAQMNMFQMPAPEAIAIARMFDQNARSSKRTAEHLRDMAEVLSREMQNLGQARVPGTKKPSSLDIINSIIKKQGELHGREGTEGYQRSILAADEKRSGEGEPTGGGRTSLSLTREGTRSLEGEQDALHPIQRRFQDSFKPSAKSIAALESSALERLGSGVQEEWRGTFQVPQSEPTEEHRRAHRIVEAFGVQTIFFESTHPRAPTLGGMFDPATPNIIYINANSHSPADWTALHESLHRLAKTDTVAYSSLKGKLWQYVQNFDEYLNDTQHIYLEAGLDPPSKKEMREEFVNDIVSDLLSAPYVRKLPVEHYITDISAAENVVKEQLAKIAGVIEPDATGTRQFSQPASMSLRQATGKITDNSAFRKWFGDSKVVDQEGKPLVVYHGTPSGGFEAFQLRPRRHGQIWGKGHYFTESRQDAEHYSNVTYGDERQVYETYLSIKNPFEPDEITTKDINKLKRAGVPREIRSILEVGAESSEEKDALYGWMQSHGREYIKRAGYDGVKYNYEGDTHYLAFEPTQIKSIFNRGTFDPKDPRILFSLGKEHKFKGVLTSESRPHKRIRRRKPGRSFPAHRDYQEGTRGTIRISLPRSNFTRASGSR
jgi:hypothetical protein